MAFIQKEYFSELCRAHDKAQSRTRTESKDSSEQLDCTTLALGSTAFFRPEDLTCVSLRMRAFRKPLKNAASVF